MNENVFATVFFFFETVRQKNHDMKWYEEQQRIYDFL